mgnify:FL=1
MPKRVLKGKIVSSKMQKTVVVAVSSFRAHPKYKKIMKITKKYKAHYEGETLGNGSIVLIEETKPISKDKRWAVKEVLSNRSKILSEE